MMFLRRQGIRATQPFYLSHVQPYTTSPRLSFPRKGAEDRNDINTDATEYSKSGTDDFAAHQTDAAYDPAKTDPQDEKDTAGEGTEANPLDVSPANPDVSQQRHPSEGGAEKGPDKSTGSGRGSPKKGKTIS